MQVVVQHTSSVTTPFDLLTISCSSFGRRHFEPPDWNSQKSEEINWCAKVSVLIYSSKTKLVIVSYKSALVKKLGAILKQSKIKFRIVFNIRSSRQSKLEPSKKSESFNETGNKSELFLRVLFSESIGSSETIGSSTTSFFTSKPSTYSISSFKPSTFSS